MGQRKRKTELLQQVLRRRFLLVIAALLAVLLIALSVGIVLGKGQNWPLFAQRVPTSTPAPPPTATVTATPLPTATSTPRPTATPKPTATPVPITNYLSVTVDRRSCIGVQKPYPTLIFTNTYPDRSQSMFWDGTTNNSTFFLDNIRTLDAQTSEPVEIRPYYKSQGPLHVVVNAYPRTYYHVPGHWDGIINPC